MASIEKLRATINPSKVGIPKQIEFGPSTFELAPSLFDPTIWERSQEVRGEPIGGFYSTGGGYRSTEPVDVNGIPVFGLYDSSGKLWKYEADHRAGAAVDGGTLYGAWDVSGNPVSVIRSSGGGGFLGSGVGPDISFTDVRDTAEAVGTVAGNYFLPGSSLLTSQLVSEGAQEQLATDEFRIANAAAGITGGMQGNMDNYGKLGESLGITSVEPNAVGGVTGPDNIDVGGGWSPATGATAAELEAARLALEAPSATGLETLPSSVNTTDQAFDTGGTEVTADQITNEISSGTAPLGSADKSALYSNAGYGDTMTSAQIDAFDKAVASGMTVSQALDYARAGLFVNAIAGDPLGLGGGAQQGASSGSTGFAQVPIPAEWKSPTYAAPSAPIDLNSIFSNQNMLGGTQWQGLPSQQNMSFNDIFAAGQQQTPMGTPVDINQIVSAILGQAATSQKPA